MPCENGTSRNQHGVPKQIRTKSTGLDTKKARKQEKANRQIETTASSLNSEMMNCWFTVEIWFFSSKSLLGLGGC